VYFEITVTKYTIYFTPSSRTSRKENSIFRNATINLYCYIKYIPVFFF